MGRKRKTATKNAPPPSQTAPPSAAARSWADVPVLGQILDLLQDPRDLAACACVCRSWRGEAQWDERWQGMWGREVSPQGLWRWSRADGGFREQLRARSLLRKGDCVASTFPFNRRDGVVTEVLMLDTSPDALLVTMQNRRPPPTSVRLQGATVKVWTSRALCSQRPLMVIHDVVKHMQLETGKVFMWRLVGDACVPIRHLDPAHPVGEDIERWAEHPAIRPFVLDPATLSLTELPLRSSYGRGIVPHEWMDLNPGALVAAELFAPQQRVALRLLDLQTGGCFRSSSCAIPVPMQEVPPLQEDTGGNHPAMLLSRNSNPAHQILATAALYDCRIFLWRLRPEWLIQQGRSAAVAAWSAAAVAAAAVQLEEPGGGGTPVQLLAALDSGAADQVDEHALRHVFTTPDNEPIVDLSISTAAARIYVVGMENLFILRLDGTPQWACNMLHWRGVNPGLIQPEMPLDVGAFSWPVPNSKAAAFFLDATNSLFVADFQPEMPTLVTRENFLFGRSPRLDSAVAWSLDPSARDCLFTVQSHTDLRPAPQSHPLHTATGRARRAAEAEQPVVEYIQSGEVLFMGADSSCHAVAALLQYERRAGTYLPGLGPKTVRRSSSAASGPALSVHVDMKAARSAPVAPRALVCIDAATGRRYKAIPVEGTLEAVHSAGHFLAMAVAPVGATAEDVHGSLVVLDFSGRGFGLNPAQEQAQREKERQAAQRAQRAGKKGKGAVKTEGPQPGFLDDWDVDQDLSYLMEIDEMEEQP